MTVTMELSLYPLNKDYPDSVLGFLKKLKAIPSISVETNGMSTLITGEMSFLWTQIGDLVREQFEKEDCIFVMKIAPGRREYV
ncbi:MAG: hypothetical protein M3R25_03900 [Bacteroidota bacterium]|nr:hypothetical protein [Bacteroidota bacterium]